MSQDSARAFLDRYCLHIGDGVEFCSGDDPEATAEATQELGELLAMYQELLNDVHSEYCGRQCWATCARATEILAKFTSKERA